MEASAIRERAATVERVTSIIAGILSGATKLLIGHPFDTVKVRIQSEGGLGRFKGPLDCLLATVRREGVFALYKGATPPLIGWGLMDATQYFALANFRLLLQGGDPSKPLTVPQHALAGLGAGVVVPLVATPVELLKSKLQVQYDKAARVYKGPIDCAKQLIRNNGPAALWFGLVPNIAFRSWFAVLWGSFPIYQDMLRKLKVPEVSVAFWAGGLAAQTFWLFALPADVIKNRYMCQPDIKPRRWNNMFEVTSYIYKTDGLKGFFRGFVPVSIRAFPMNSCAIFVMDYTMKTGRRYGNY
ncbi:hypothetical protein SmJEL517_g01297 [Synchytrium microbalum]|uniref:Mitochondrial carrier domain-containing protein n=1 Tax=Synchytrium microbalum TaxID=1806994 RepID=A0A507CF94_9FUNG|nr:uncharacterized protein SmJEL517_g01297 [Synchytrium microbalum]TPX36594.1 hypothetical protein SmJEL517_g01297 [Synchytrium microbalum]